MLCTWYEPPRLEPQPRLGRCTYDETVLRSAPRRRSHRRSHGIQPDLRAARPVRPHTAGVREPLACHKATEAARGVVILIHPPPNGDARLLLPLRTRHPPCTCSPPRRVAPGRAHPVSRVRPPLACTRLRCPGAVFCLPGPRARHPPPRAMEFMQSMQRQQRSLAVANDVVADYERSLEGLELGSDKREVREGAARPAAAAPPPRQDLPQAPRPPLQGTRGAHSSWVAPWRAEGSGRMAAGGRTLVFLFLGSACGWLGFSDGGSCPLVPPVGARARTPRRGV